MVADLCDDNPYVGTRPPTRTKRPIAPHCAPGWHPCRDPTNLPWCSPKVSGCKGCDQKNHSVTCFALMSSEGSTNDEVDVAVFSIAGLIELRPGSSEINLHLKAEYLCADLPSQPEDEFLGTPCSSASTVRLSLCGRLRERSPIQRRRSPDTIAQFHLGERGGKGPLPCGTWGRLSRRRDTSSPRMKTVAAERFLLDMLIPVRSVPIKCRRNGQGAAKHAHADNNL